MDWIAAAWEWTKSNPAILWWLFAGSAVMFVLTPVAVAWAVVRLPADYFRHRKGEPLATYQRHPAVRLLLFITKNLVGIVLLIAGLAMLVLPGQGLLTIVVGLILIDFPGKLRLERWMATRPPVWRSLNWLRRRAGRAELKRPE
jgi:hypothetical protein